MQSTSIAIILIKDKIKVRAGRMLKLRNFKLTGQKKTGNSFVINK